MPRKRLPLPRDYAAALSLYLRQHERTQANACPLNKRATLALARPNAESVRLELHHKPLVTWLADGRLIIHPMARLFPRRRIGGYKWAEVLAQALPAGLAIVRHRRRGVLLRTPHEVLSDFTITTYIDMAMLTADNE